MNVASRLSLFCFLWFETFRLKNIILSSGWNTLWSNILNRRWIEALNKFLNNMHNLSIDRILILVIRCVKFWFASKKEKVRKIAIICKCDFWRDAQLCNFFYSGSIFSSFFRWIHTCKSWIYRSSCCFLFVMIMQGTVILFFSLFLVYQPKNCCWVHLNYYLLFDVEAFIETGHYFAYMHTFSMLCHCIRFG